MSVKESWSVLVIGKRIVELFLMGSVEELSKEKYESWFAYKLTLDVMLSFEQ